MTWHAQLQLKYELENQKPCAVACTRGLCVFCKASIHEVIPFVTTNIKALSGLQDVVSFIESKGMLKAALA